MAFKKQFLSIFSPVRGPMANFGRTHSCAPMFKIKELALAHSLSLALEAGHAKAHLFHIITVSYLRGNAGGYADLS